MTERLTGEQHVWDCRWARLAGVRTPLRRGNAMLTMMWGCDRDQNQRRSVEDDECTRCIHWVRDGLPN